MKQDLHYVFKSISEIEPSPKLEGLVLSKIQFLKEKQTKRKLIFSYLGLAGSFGSFVLAVFSYGQILFNSDFWNLLKLLATDAGIIFENRNDFVLSLLETFPAASLAIILIPAFVLLVSLSAYFKSIYFYKNHFNYV